jgi:hypothetical protein
MVILKPCQIEDAHADLFEVSQKMAVLQLILAQKRNSSMSESAKSQLESLAE